MIRKQIIITLRIVYTKINPINLIVICCCNFASILMINYHYYRILKKKIYKS